MWRKTETNEPKVTGGLPVPASPAQQPSATPEGDSAAVAVSVSQGIRIKGEIFGVGDLVMDGTFEGKVHLPDGAFTVGPHGRVNADITAREIVIRGEVIGSLKARERVHVASTGRLTGDMDTRGIVIDDGAILHSKIATPQAAPTQAVSAPSPREGASAASASAKAATPEPSSSAPHPAAETAAVSSPDPSPKEDQPAQPTQVDASPRSKRAAAGSAANANEPIRNPDSVL